MNVGPVVGNDDDSQDVVCISGHPVHALVVHYAVVWFGRVPSAPDPVEGRPVPKRWKQLYLVAKRHRFVVRFHRLGIC